MASVKDKDIFRRTGVLENVLAVCLYKSWADQYKSRFLEHPLFRLLSKFVKAVAVYPSKVLT